MVAYFTATWCPPSNNFKPRFVKITSLFKSVSFVTVDADKGRDVYEFTSVTSIPSFKMYVNGKVVETISGADEATLLKKQEDHGVVSYTEECFQSTQRGCGRPCCTGERLQRRAATARAEV